MKELKVYIIDSCVLMRRTLVNILRKTEGVKVIGSTSGKDEEGVAYILKHFNPDAILLGVEEDPSNEMDLFLTIRENNPFLPVILVTPNNKKGAVIALSGLKKGAVEYITKPERKTSLTFAQHHFQKRVIPAVKRISSLNRDMLASAISVPDLVETETIHDTRLKLSTRSGIELVAVAGSMGGIRSLYQMIAGLPDPLPFPVVVVQPMPGMYTEVLMEELIKLTTLPVCEVKGNSLIKPGRIYLAPGGVHTIIRNDGYRKYLSIHRGPREHKNRPSIDVFMRSASQAFPGKTLGVYLSGTGTDGILGAKYITESGGSVILENRESALIWDLPERIRELGLSDGEYRADRLGREIILRILKDRKNLLETTQPTGKFRSV